MTNVWKLGSLLKDRYLVRQIIQSSTTNNIYVVEDRLQSEKLFILLELIPSSRIGTETKIKAQLKLEESLAIQNPLIDRIQDWFWLENNLFLVQNYNLETSKQSSSQTAIPLLPPAPLEPNIRRLTNLDTAKLNLKFNFAPVALVQNSTLASLSSFTQSITPARLNQTDELKSAIAWCLLGIGILGTIFWLDLNRFPATYISDPLVEYSSDLGIAELEPSLISTQTTYKSAIAVTRSLSKKQALDLIRQWLQAKHSLFSPPYDRSLASEILTGKAYETNIRRGDGAESSVEWLENRRAYYVFGRQNINEVKQFSIAGEEAQITVLITEERSLYNKYGQKDLGSSNFKTSLVRYDLSLEQGQWKIANYQIIE